MPESGTETSRAILDPQVTKLQDRLTVKILGKGPEY